MDRVPQSNSIYVQGTINMAETAVIWALRQRQSEILVTFGASTAWHGLQHALRAFLIQEHETQVLHHLLHLDQEHQDLQIQSHVSAIGHWLALRASERDLLPLVIHGGQFLRIDGFDAFEEENPIGKRQFIRSMPYILKTWAKVLPRSLENVKGLVEAELDVVLGELSIDRESLVRCIQMATKKPPRSKLILNARAFLVAMTTWIWGPALYSLGESRSMSIGLPSTNSTVNVSSSSAR
jgi:hypothetical protein